MVAETLYRDISMQNLYIQINYAMLFFYANAYIYRVLEYHTQVECL